MLQPSRDDFLPFFKDTHSTLAIVVSVQYFYVFKKNEQSEILNMEGFPIRKAIDELTQATGLMVNWEPAADTSFDGYLVIQIDNHMIRFATEVKHKASIHLSSQMAILREKQGDALLVAGHFPADVKEAFRRSEINYLDVAGNCFIKTGGHLLFIQGRKATVVTSAIKPPFGKSGLRVLFTLLIRPDTINLSLRELAEQSGVSIGTAQSTIDYLKKSGYTVAVDAQRRKLVQLEKLREQWVSRYATALRPSLMLGRFRLPKDISPDNWQKLVVQSGTYWSGEAAADALTNTLRPGTLTLYTEEDQPGLRQKYRLLPDPNGSVDVYRLFWKATELTTDVPTVPPLLIYADLLATTEPRTLDVARHIYQDYVQHTI